MTGEFTDAILNCVQCKAEFIWTAGEQRFYMDRGLQEPKRCGPCRTARKAAKSGVGGEEREDARGNKDYNRRRR